MNVAANKIVSETAEPEKSALIALAVIAKDGFKNAADVVEFPIYWILIDKNEETIDSSILKQALAEVLADSLLENLWSSFGGQRQEWQTVFKAAGFGFYAERQFLPGVTDNLARTVEEALHLKGVPPSIKVASGRGFLFKKKQSAEEGMYKFFHPLADRFKIHDLAEGEIKFLQFPAVHLPEVKEPEIISLDLNDQELVELSKNRLLALNLAEMQAIKKHYQGLNKWPTDVELEVIAQTWSEHCKHKIFSAKISYRDKEKKTTIDSLYKTYIQGPTYELMKKRDDLLSVFEDNSGVIRWTEEQGVCFKVETHNSPSALEPYGGALTGILGVNRDVLGTGLGARPIFNTDVFCFAYPSESLAKRPKLLPAETIIKGVRKGVQDGGNKSGIPTVNGAVVFHPGYRAKPLVFCGTGGILPLTVAGKSGVEKHTKIQDRIVVVGGRVGKDGIHGATFSSEALHEGSPVSAVQIGDPFTQKRVSDFVLEARDRGLITGITDNGAGGLSSSIGEMARITNGATLILDNVPLKYPGLSDYEIVISESQERMSISTDRPEELLALAKKFNVEACDLGEFEKHGYFKILRSGKTVAMLDLQFLHKGAPRLELEAEWQGPASLPEKIGAENSSYKTMLLALLSHPNVCSRESVIRQYDHEVQGGSVVKPLMGRNQKAACDAAVIKPILDRPEGLVVANGLCPQLSKYDARLMAQCAVDEAVRNAVCVGANPKSLVLLDNFCWTDPVFTDKNPEGKFKLAQLVRACQGLADSVYAYGTPLISGKDSMKNDFDDGVVRLSIPPTLLVSAMGKIDDAAQVVTMEFKNPGDLIYIVSAASLGFAGSLVADIAGWDSANVPEIDPQEAALLYEQTHEAIKAGLVQSAHDLSDGGLGVALAECCIGSELGARLQAEKISTAAAACIPDSNVLAAELKKRLDFALFAEGPARLLVSVKPENKAAWEQIMQGISCVQIGSVESSAALVFTSAEDKVLFSVELAEMLGAWETLLPFAEEES
ncbi:MAG: hypothetical protein K2W82_00755 [Candidatus Obscuribacterales bacterium]|nr:hypothetical protein [Candidatus Obscuribacterales bacterium]